MSVLLWIAVGCFIGWNLPQPTWAAELQEKVGDWWKDHNNKDDK